MAKQFEPLVRWEVTNRNKDGIPVEWKLVVGRRKQVAATVWRDSDGGATWHTWDQTGVGGENDVERQSTSERSCRRARLEAAAAAIEQGFV